MSLAVMIIYICAEKKVPLVYDLMVPSGPSRTDDFLLYLAMDQMTPTKAGVTIFRWHRGKTGFTDISLLPPYHGFHYKIR